MTKMGKLSIVVGLLSLVTASHAGINSKEIGALLIVPEYRATHPDEDSNATWTETYVSITNDKSTSVRTHIVVVGGTACDDCGFDLTLTGYQTRRLRLSREFHGGVWSTVIHDASPHSETGAPSILTACTDPLGFIVVTLEEPGSSPAITIGSNALHGDAVVADLDRGTSWQVGAIAVQGVGENDKNRELRFDNMEYAAFPDIVTANFWSPNEQVEPRLVLFNVDFQTGTRPRTQCIINYVNAEEDVFGRSFSFGCWSDAPLSTLAPGFLEDILGTANGFLWVRCDAGTHGAMVTSVNGELTSEHADTLFQSVTGNREAVLELTSSIAGAAPAPGDIQ